MTATSTVAVDINYGGAPRHPDGSIRVFRDYRQPVQCLVCGQRFIPGPDDAIAPSYHVIPGDIFRADEVVWNREMFGICMRHKLNDLSRMSLDFAQKAFRNDGVACFNHLTFASKCIKEGN